MFNINLLAVVVSAIGSMILGSIWYGPLFGKVWMKMTGMGDMSAEQMAAAKKGMGKKYFWQFLGSLVTAYVMGQVVMAFGAMDLMGGIKVGFWIWLGFLATESIGMMLWEGKPMKLWLLTNGYNLIQLCMFGAIMALWQ